MTTRVHPLPTVSGVVRSPQIANGRTYTPAVGTPQDVPDADARQLCATQGWWSPTMWGFGGGSAPGVNQSGTTAQRPTAQAAGQPLSLGTRYADTSLSKVIWWDGVANWRDEFSGATL